MALDEIAATHGFGPWKSRFQGLACEGRFGSEKVLLLKPMTYMNESGRAAGEAMRFFKLTPEDLFVFHDDLDLAPGKVKVKQGGGHAGHNGLKSLTAHCGADFWRVRLGIGHPGDKSRVTGHVLGDFAKADAQWLDPMLDAIGAAAPALIEGRPDKFMSDVAQAMCDVEPPSTRPAPAQPQPAKQSRPSAPEPSAPTALGEKLRRWLGG
jgi:PTH1 family peptidyl-tRNA hydrolase